MRTSISVVVDDDKMGMFVPLNVTVGVTKLVPMILTIMVSTFTDGMFEMVGGGGTAVKVVDTPLGAASFVTLRVSVPDKLLGMVKVRVVPAAFEVAFTGAPFTVTDVKKLRLVPEKVIGLPDTPGFGLPARNVGTKKKLGVCTVAVMLLASVLATVMGPEIAWGTRTTIEFPDGSTDNTVAVPTSPLKVTVVLLTMK
jgi:hypothetical protein